MEEQNRELFESIDGLGVFLSAVLGAVVVNLVGSEVGASTMGRLGLGAGLGAGVYVVSPIFRLIGKGLDAALEAIDRKLSKAEKQRSKYNSRTEDYDRPVAKKNTIPKKVQKLYNMDPKFQEYIATRQKEEYKRWEDRGKPGFFGPTPLNPLAEYRKYKQDQKFKRQQERNDIREQKRVNRVLRGGR